MADHFESSFSLERTRYINQEEFEALLHAARRDRRAWTAFYTKGNLGLRVSELVSLTPAQLHPEREEFEILTRKQKKFKKKADGTMEKIIPRMDSVPADPDVLLEILAYAKSIRCKPHERIWPYTERALMYWWDEYAAKAKIAVKGIPARDGQKAKRGRGIHSLRHFKAFHAKEHGADLKTTAQLLRHRSLGSTMIYWHTEGLREKVREIGKVGAWNGNGEKPPSSGKRSRRKATPPPSSKRSSGAGESSSGAESR